jgi:hypothetical protein
MRVAANDSSVITLCSRQPASSGIRLRAVARHSHPSSSVASWAGESDTVPAADIGQRNCRPPGPASVKISRTLAVHCGCVQRDRTVP